MRVIISGGGTGGHIFPAIAIANALKARDNETEILFIGAEGKMEMEKVPQAGYKIIGLPIRGFQRKLTLKNLSFPFKLFSSLWKVRKVIKDFQPDIAVGVGGYASGPTLQIAGANGIPTLLQEQNSYAGVTNKILARKASKICVAYDGMEKFFPGNKVVFTGNPVRAAIFENAISRSDACQKLGIDENKKTALIFGGSLGARTLNQSIASGYELLSNRKDLNLIWQVGKLYFDEYKNSKLAQLSNVKILAFIEDMPSAYAAADVVVCRAGALTISELSVVNKASILVPSPNVAEDHQTKNAMALVNKQAAMMVKDNDARETLVDVMLSLIDDEGKQKELESNIQFFARPYAAKDIANEIVSIVNKT